MLIPAFLEFTYPIRIIVFSSGQRLLVPIYDTFLFDKIKEKERELKMNLIILVVIVVTNKYANKIVLNLELGTWIKG